MHIGDTDYPDLSEEITKSWTYDQFKAVMQGPADAMGADLKTQTEGFIDWISGKFPFSLLHNPLGAFATSSTAPVFEIRIRDTDYRFDLSAFDDLFRLFRAVVGVLLIFGFFSHTTGNNKG